MKKNFQSTFILLGVFAALLAWYLVYEKTIRPKQAEKEEQSKLILAFERDGIQEMIVQQREGDEKSTKYSTLAFKKSGSDWVMTSPIEDQAETGVVSGMLSVLDSAKHDRIVDEKPATIEPYGLTNPRIKITLKKDSNSAPMEVLVGNDTPIGSSLYAKVAGRDAIYRAPQSLRTSFDKRPAEYRNKQVINTKREQVTEFEIVTGGETIVFKKPANSPKWMLARDGMPANDNEVNKTLNAVLEMRATSIAQDKPLTPAKWGLAPASATITLKKADGQQLVSFGQVKDKFYALRGDKPTVYEIPKDPFEKVTRPSKAYRDMRLAEFNRFNARKLSIQHGPDTFELVKEVEWKLASDPQVKVDGAKVDDYLTRLQDVKVTAFLDGKQKPSKTDLTIKVSEKQGDKYVEAVVLNIAKPVDGKAIGERVGLPMPFSLMEPDFKKINAFKQEFLVNDKKVENKTGTGKS